jgi:hypothetical protein
MVDVIALAFSLIVFVAASVGIALGLDCTLFRIRPRVQLSPVPRYSLRTLVIATAIGPPLLATVWTNRESLLALRAPVKVHIPARTSRREEAKLLPARTSRREEAKLLPARTGWREEAKLRAQASRREGWHWLAGAGAIVSYPVAVILLASVFGTMRHWRQPPKKTPLTWAALGASALSASFVLAYFLTFPPPWGYTSWSAYFASDGQPPPWSVGRR